MDIAAWCFFFLFSYPQNPGEGWKMTTRVNDLGLLLEWPPVFADITGDITHTRVYTVVRN